MTKSFLKRTKCHHGPPITSPPLPRPNQQTRIFVGSNTPCVDPSSRPLLQEIVRCSLGRRLMIAFFSGCANDPISIRLPSADSESARGWQGDGSLARPCGSRCRAFITDFLVRMTRGFSRLRSSSSDFVALWALNLAGNFWLNVRPLSRWGLSRKRKPFGAACRTQAEWS